MFNRYLPAKEGGTITDPPEPLETIAAWLDQEDIMYDTQSGMVTFKIFGKLAEYDASFNWDESMILQFACGWTNEIPKRRVGQLRQLLEHLNFDLTFGRVLQYPAAHMVLFHASTPVINRQVKPEEIRLFLDTGGQIMDMFLLMIGQVIAGKSAKETIAEKQFLLTPPNTPMC